MTDFTDLPRTRRRADDRPLVSVIVPCYGDADYLPRALASIHEQTYPAVESVVVDGGDNNTLRARAQEADWITYLHQPPIGVAAARNAGLEHASGEYVAFCDADDWWRTIKLNAQMQAVRDGGDFVYSDQFVLKDGTTHRQHALRLDGDAPHVTFFRRGQGIGSRTVLVDANLVDPRPFDSALPGREDTHLWTRLLAAADRPVRINEPLATKRRRDASLTRDPATMYQAERAEIASLCEAFPELADYRAEREAQARFRYARRCLRTGDLDTASEYLVALLDDGHGDYRMWACYLLSLLPQRLAGRVYTVLERGQEGVKKVT